MPRARLPSEDPSESYDEVDSDDLDELSPDEIPGELECANCRVISTRELFQQMIKQTIDVDPPYQRDVVWTKAAQSSLIDSIFKNKWVPTLLFSERVVTSETVDKQGRPKGHAPQKKKIWVCMDGKQRLTSIKLFLMGKIPWMRQPGKQWYFKQSNPPSPSRLIISEELQETFLRRGITTALYHQLEEIQERDIFRLVQEGKPLTVGEKLQAAAGPWGEYFEVLRQTYMARDSKHVNGWCGRVVKMSRGADFKTMASMVLLIRDMFLHPAGAPSSLSTVQLQGAFVKLQNEPICQKFQEEVTMLLNVFMNITLLAPPNTPYTLELGTPEAIFAPIKQGRKTMISPIEMVWIPYLIKYHGRLSIARLLELIELFKVEIRIKFPADVKDNTTVIKFILNWITNIDTGRLTGKYSGFRVPQKPESSRVNPSSSSASQTQSGPSEGPPSVPPGKRKVSLQNDSDTAPTTTSKRPRQSAPHPSRNPAQSATATPQSRPNQKNIPSSAPVNNNGSGASAATRPKGGGTRADLGGTGIPNAEATRPLFTTSTQSRPDTNRVGQMSSFGASTTQQFGQPPSLAARGGMDAYRSSQQTHAAPSARASYATARPF